MGECRLRAIYTIGLVSVRRPPGTCVPLLSSSDGQTRRASGNNCCLTSRDELGAPRTEWASMYFTNMCTSKNGMSLLSTVGQEYGLADRHVPARRDLVLVRKAGVTGVAKSRT